MNINGHEFDHFVQHPLETAKVVLNGVMPYLDDYIMGAHDPFVEDFVWAMDDNRHTDATSKELTETDFPKLLLFAGREVNQAVQLPKSQGEMQQELLLSATRTSSDTGKAYGRTS